MKFHVDLGVGDEVLEPLENVEGEDWLGFAGIPAVVVPALSIEQHWAEKLHAYTRPRETPNSRVRDLVDLVLILNDDAGNGAREGGSRCNVPRRGTHSVPDVCRTAVGLGEAVCGSRGRLWAGGHCGNSTSTRYGLSGATWERRCA